MLVLAFDTSTFQVSIGWIRLASNGDQSSIEAHAEMTAPARPGHAETLMERMESILGTGDHTVEDVDLVVFGRGPGTFTGLRIGMATAKGINLSHGTPMVGISTLEALALSSGVSGCVVPLIDARRGEIYAAAYQVKHQDGVPIADRLMEETVTRPELLHTLLAKTGSTAPLNLLGSGAARYRVELDQAGPILPVCRETPSAYLMAEKGLELFNKRGGDDPASAEPNYLREPDARLPEKPLI